MPLLSEIISLLKLNGHQIIDSGIDPNISIVGGKNIFEAGANEITFLSSKYKEQASALLSNVKAPLVILDSELMSDLGNTKFSFCIALSNEPKSTMVDCLKKFFEEKIKPEIHPTAIINSTAKIGKQNFIGAYTVIDKDVIIGDNCVIESNVNIRHSCVIGNNVLIKSGTVIGGKGFGYVKDANGVWENFPHFGKVIIEDNVEIGSNTCIDRGALGDTILKKGVKVDNLVHVAHNVRVEENSLLIADSMIGGSVIIGKNTWIAPSAVLRNGITIGSDCVVGMGAIVTKSVADGETVAGNPAATIQKKK